jgi:HSP20 family protein
MFWDFNSWKELERVRKDVERALNSRSATALGRQYPPVNLYESKDAVVVTAEMPGVNRDTVSITLTGDVLSVSGNVIAQVDESAYKVVRRERAIGIYEKQIRIPQTVDHNAIGASLVNGILTITLTKTEAAKPKQISISVQ